MDIDEEIKQIKYYIKNFDNQCCYSNNINDTNDNINVNFEEKGIQLNQNKNQGNTYALEQFKFKQNYLNYKRKKNV